MKNLFKKAHEMTRKMKESYPEVDYQAQFGLCLSYLFEEEKEEEGMKELKGTPKQIAWAEKIREEQMESFNRFKERWIEKRKAEGNQEELDYIEELTQKIENLDQAADWITIKQKQVTLHKLLVPKRRENEMKYLEGIL
jgi:hypothetical protein